MAHQELAARIKELKRRQDELSKTRVHVEVDMVVQGVEEEGGGRSPAYYNPWWS